MRRRIGIAPPAHRRVSGTPTGRPSDKLAISLQRAVGNQATGQILQRVHFHTVRGVISDYASEETGGKKTLFMQNVKEDLQRLAAQHVQVVEAAAKSATTVPAATPGGQPVLIDNAKRTLSARRELYKRQFPDVLGSIPVDWDFKLTATQLNDIEASMERVERHGVTAGAPRPEETLVTVNAGTLKRANGLDVDTAASSTFFSGVGWEIFVMSWTGEVHMTSHFIGKRHHSSLLAAKDTAAAGEMKVAAGKIERLSNKSGHYKPDITEIQQCLHLLNKRGVALDFTVDIYDSSGKSTQLASAVYNENRYRAGKAQHGKAKAEAHYQKSHQLYTEEVVSKHVSEAIAQTKGWKSVEVREDEWSDPIYQLQTMDGRPVDEQIAYRAYKEYLHADKQNPLPPTVKEGTTFPSRSHQV